MVQGDVSAATAVVLRSAVALAALTMLLLVSGCDQPDYDSPIINEDVPAMDIANLPDIEATRTQMLDLIERVRAEVTRLVPASAPWTWRREEMKAGCQENGRQGVALYFANLTSPHSFNDAEWNLAYPAVQRLAAEAGLTGGTAMQDSTRAHDVRLTSDDGRTLVFGSIEASLITGSIACRAREGEGA